ncbi:hypothetical protein ROZALSC1DRAFT_20893 [Rozella allomycis CSF55]|uniref:Uncharacterized protein n=1 Tax=Rozella allomycis (strain CSF55) TaxID=988480 RepID=A0A4P9YN61_ROZAC|nr:hypothetical protein ROZALSC1DRAFT_20893 [Rozella allomycis CSF55]
MIVVSLFAIYFVATYRTRLMLLSFILQIVSLLYFIAVLIITIDPKFIERYNLTVLNSDAWNYGYSLVYLLSFGGSVNAYFLIIPSVVVCFITVENKCFSYADYRIGSYLDD